MYDDVLLERIRDYLRANQATYTLEALRERLVADGAPPDAVDRVIAEMRASPYYGPAPAGASAVVPDSRWNVKKFFAVLAGVTTLNVLGVAGAAALSFATESAWAFGAVGLLALAAEIAAAVVYAKKNTTVTVALVVAIVLTPVVVGVLLAGACIAILIGMNGKIGG
jgi:hypothetical protein